MRWRDTAHRWKIDNCRGSPSSGPAGSSGLRLQRARSQQSQPGCSRRRRRRRSDDAWRRSRCLTRPNNAALLWTFQLASNRRRAASSFRKHVVLTLSPCLSSWPAHDAHLAALAAAAEEAVLAIGLQTRDGCSLRHVELMQHLAALGIDSSEIALVVFPGAVPELAIDPRDPGDKARAGNGAQDLAGVGIDLVDLALAIDADPQCTFGPGQSGIAAAAGRGDGRKHATRPRIDLLDASFRDLEQMRSIERGAGMRREFDPAQGRARGGIG